MSKEFCGKMIQKPNMPEPRPCMRKRHRRGGCTPDLANMNFKTFTITHRADDRVTPSGKHRTYWWALDKNGNKREVSASDIFNGHFSGTHAPTKSGVGSKNKEGTIRPEYNTISSHHQRMSNPNNPRYGLYKNLTFYGGWDPKKGGSLLKGMNWIIENLGPKPDPTWELHIIKSRQYPHGFFGPGGIVWRHKIDRHEQDLLDHIYDMPIENLIELQNEIKNILIKEGRTNGLLQTKS